VVPRRNSSPDVWGLLKTNRLTSRIVTFGDNGLARIKVSGKYRLSPGLSIVILIQDSPEGRKNWNFLPQFLAENAKRPERSGAEASRRKLRKPRKRQKIRTRKRRAYLGWFGESECWRFLFPSCSSRKWPRASSKRSGESYVPAAICRFRSAIFTIRAFLLGASTMR